MLVLSSLLVDIFKTMGEKSKMSKLVLRKIYKVNVSYFQEAIRHENCDLQKSPVSKTNPEIGMAKTVHT